MEFNLISPEKLKVQLTAKELETRGLTYDEMEYSDPAFREMLVSILEEGRERTGFHPMRARLFIQVFPGEGGSCVIIFTCLRGGQTPPTRVMGAEAVVFIFNDVDTLLDAAVKAYTRYGQRIYKSSLYLMDKGYRLIIYPLDYVDRLSVLFIGEYAEQSGEGPVLAAFIEEHGKLIVADDALGALAQYFG